MKLFKVFSRNSTKFWLESQNKFHFQKFHQNPRHFSENRPSPLGIRLYKPIPVCTLRTAQVMGFWHIFFRLHRCRVSLSSSSSSSSSTATRYTQTLDRVTWCAAPFVWNNFYMLFSQKTNFVLKNCWNVRDNNDFCLLSWNILLLMFISTRRARGSQTFSM